MKKLDYEEGKEEELTARKRELMQEIGSLKEQVEALEARWVGSSSPPRSHSQVS